MLLWPPILNGRHHTPVNIILLYDEWNTIWKLEDGTDESMFRYFQHKISYPTRGWLYQSFNIIDNVSSKTVKLYLDN